MASIHALSESTKGLPILATTSKAAIHYCPPGYTDRINLLLINYGGTATVLTVEWDDGTTQREMVIPTGVGAVKESIEEGIFTVSDGVTINVTASVNTQVSIGGTVVRTAAD